MCHHDHWCCIDTGVGVTAEVMDTGLNVATGVAEAGTGLVSAVLDAVGFSG